jgi:hypothetical protein
LSTGDNKPEFWKLKLTADIGNKESAFANCLKKPISQPNLEMYPTWILLLSKELNNLQRTSA